MPFGKIFRTVSKVITAPIKIFSKAFSWLQPKIDIPDFSVGEFDDFEKGVLLNKQSNDAAIPVVYGTRLIGGTRVFLQTSGTDNEFLYMALILSEGEINAISEIRVDDKVVTFDGSLADNTQRDVASSDSNFYKDSVSYIRIEPHFGADDQSASSLLSTLSSWGSNHKLSGIAYLALRFKWNQDIFGTVPKVQAIIQGRKVSTFNSSSVETTGQFSSNPAFCLLDYLRNERFGKGLALTDIDIPSFVQAASDCETQVTPFSGGSDINVFDCNAVVDTSLKVIDNVREFLKGCRGYLPYTSGKYKLIIEKTGSASVTLTEDDIIGGFNLQSADKNNKYNRVIVSYVNPARNYQVDEAQFPPIDDSGLSSADQHANIKSADGGFLLEGRFDFKNLTSTYQAEEMAEVILRRSREALKIDINCGLEAYRLEIADIVGVTHASLGFSAKNFRVIGMTFNEDYTIGLSLVEHQDSHYTWASKTQVSSTPTTNLPNPFAIQAPASITLSDELIEYSDGVVITRLNILVGASTDQFVQYYQVEAKQSTESDFKILGKATQLNYEMLNVVDGKTYDVRVKAINALGISSSYISSSRKIVGATDTPSDVPTLAVSMTGSDQMQLQWTPVTDLDVSFYTIRYQDVTSNANWNASTNLIQVARRKSNSVTVNARTGAFLIKAVDKLGNESANETIVFTNISSLEHFENISTLNEEAADSVTGRQFSGTFDGNAVEGMDSSDIHIATLDTITLFDSTVGNFDSAEGLFDLGGTDTTSNPTNATANIESSGFYIGSNTFSLDAIYDATFQATIDMVSNDLYDLFDSGRGASLFDDAVAPFDGNSGTKVNAFLQVGASTTSLDDISTFIDISQQSTIKGRFFKFRLKLTSDDNKARPEVSKMQVKLVLEKRLESSEDIVSGAGAKAITFTNAFFATPALGIAAQNMVSGDYYAITSKSKTGFTITFFNSSNSAIDRTFDFVAKGHGLKSSS
jgi:fibronectin type 3 domain-containing protein